jgi:hypothetical protein
MKQGKWKQLLLAGTLLATASPGGLIQTNKAMADAPRTPEQSFEALQEQVGRQQKLIELQQQRLLQLERSQDQNWLNEQRTQEVKALIHEVLADADTRSSLLESSLTAGYKNGFYINAEDGTFGLRLNVESQIRYIYNSRKNEAATTDADTNGFQIRRARFDIRGHAFDPKLTYRLRFDGDRADGDAVLQYAYVGYTFAPKWNIQVGQFKPLFLREENISSFRQLAVERSYSADYFTIDYAQGAELTYAGEWFRPSLTFYDGSYTQNSEFNADRTNFAIAGRGEFKLAGDWKQFGDFTSWSKDKFGLLLGIAAAYERGEEGGGTNTPDVFKYTADISAEYAGLNLFAALYGQTFKNNGSTAGLPTNLDDASQLGFVAQAGAFVIPDKLELFGRYEWIDFDGVYYRNSGAATSSTKNLVGEDNLNIVTFGANYYFRKHNLKATIDLQWVLDPLPASNTGSGLLSSADEDQIALRTQLQWSF